MSTAQHPEVAPRLETAKRVARAAGELLRGFSDDLHVEYKTSRDLVTAADLAAQELIVAALRGAFPDDEIVAEEGLLETPRSGYWVVDPLDGTVNYSRGLPLYGVSIAYVDADGRLQVGAIHLPVFDELYWASAGGGAFLNGRRISVSETSAIERALVNISDFNTGPEQQREQFNQQKVEAIRRVHGRCMRTKNLSSAAVELAWVAAGRLDAYYMVFCHFWDAAAGSLLIREAGGRVSDVSGVPLSADSTLVLTSNATLHDRLVRLFSDQ
jgi:myo-inositol-1(or 4)-monophosphatase